MNELTTLGSAVNKIMPLMIKGLFIVGIAVIVSGMVIAIWNFIMKKSRKEIGRQLLYTMGAGLLAILSGVITSFMFHYEPDFGIGSMNSSVKWSIIILILILVLTNIIYNRVSCTSKKE